MPQAAGTTPHGTASEAEASRWVRGMFSRIAHRYDLLNHVLSFNIDRGWRRRAVEAVRPILDRSDARVLDLCCGTGDLTLAMSEGARARVWGSDFCHPMLVLAGAKGVSRRFEADALVMPVADDSFDLITTAFGFRNLTNYAAGLRELHRILRPGGTLAILEFSTPPNALLKATYSFYSSRILPTLGGWISGSPEAYKYLPESVSRFPDAPALASAMESAGFHPVSFERMTFGAVALHLGRK